MMRRLVRPVALALAFAFGASLPVLATAPVEAANTVRLGGSTSPSVLMISGLAPAISMVLSVRAATPLKQASKMTVRVHHMMHQVGMINDQVDAAYRAKYSISPLLAAMIGPSARAATMRIDPRGTKPK